MFDTSTLIASLAGVFTTVVSGVTSWFFTKKKYNAEVEGNVIKNMQDSLEFYKNLNDDMNKRLEKVLHDNEELNNHVIALQSEILEIYKFLGVRSKEELTELKNKINS